MSAQTKCYDFPNYVLHAPGCPRQRPGGVCHPEPEPTEPYTEDERIAVEFNKLMEARLHGRRPLVPYGSLGSIDGKEVTMGGETRALGTTGANRTELN